MCRVSYPRCNRKSAYRQTEVAATVIVRFATYFRRWYEKRQGLAGQDRRSASNVLSHRLCVFVGREHNGQWHRDNTRRGKLHSQTAEVLFTGGAQRFHTNLAGANKHPYNITSVCNHDENDDLMNANRRQRKINRIGHRVM